MAPTHNLKHTEQNIIWCQFYDTMTNEYLKTNQLSWAINQCQTDTDRYKNIARTTLLTNKNYNDSTTLFKKLLELEDVWATVLFYYKYKYKCKYIYKCEYIYKCKYKYKCKNRYKWSLTNGPCSCFGRAMLMTPLCCLRAVPPNSVSLQLTSFRPVALILFLAVQLMLHRIQTSSSQFTFTPVMALYSMPIAPLPQQG